MRMSHVSEFGLRRVHVRAGGFLSLIGAPF